MTYSESWTDIAKDRPYIQSLEVTQNSPHKNNDTHHAIKLFSSYKI